MSSYMFPDRMAILGKAVPFIYNLRRTAKVLFPSLFVHPYWFICLFVRLSVTLRETNVQIPSCKETIIGNISFFVYIYVYIYIYMYTYFEITLDEYMYLVHTNSN